MKRRRVLYVILPLIVLAAVIAVLNFTLRGNRYDTAIPIRGYTVSKGKLEDRVSGNGTFTPKDAITVVAQASGEVKSIDVAESRRVAAGDVLLTLRDDDYVLAARKMRAALDSARRGIRQSLVTLRAQYRGAASALAEAERALDRSTELYAGRSISEEMYQKSVEAVESAKVNSQSAREQLALRCGLPLDSEPPLDSSEDAQIIEAAPEVEQALLSLQSAEDSVGRCTITAPRAGTVTQVRPSVGDMVAPPAPLVRIENLDTMLAEIQVDEVDIGKIHVGQPAEITSDSLIGLTLRGVVEAISPTVTALGSTRVGLVHVRIDRASLPAKSGDTPLRSGASCTARITTSITQGALLIPLASFVTEENVSSVYLLVPTGKTNAAGAEVFTMSKRPVTTGVSDVNFVEATAGLSEGDRIAAGNLKLLRDGVMVTLRQD